MVLSDYLSREQLIQFTKKNNTYGLFLVVWIWTQIACGFFAAFYWQNWICYLLVVLFFAGRQLGLAILVHEATHNLLNTNRRVNDFLGKWLVGYPLMINLDDYRRVHLQHHKHAGTMKDPDLPNYRSYPVSKSSFRRKIFRDFFGLTGIKLFVSLTRVPQHSSREQYLKFVVSGLFVQLIVFCIDRVLKW